jgi:hypothetical protein
MKYLRLVVPTSIFILCCVNLVLAAIQQNDMAISANVTALFGWLIVSGDEWFKFKTSNSVKE